MNPLEEFLMEKAATFGGPDVAKQGLGHFGSAMVGAAGVGAGAAMFAAGATTVGKIYDAATAKRDFRKMLEWHADLGQEDQKLVTQAFRTLRQFAPDMSKDPLVSGSLVRHIVAAPQGAAGMIQEAMQGQRNIGRPVRDTFLAGTQSGMTEGMKGFAPYGKYPTSKETDLRATHAKEKEEWGKTQAGLEGELKATKPSLPTALHRSGGIKGSGSVRP